MPAGESSSSPGAAAQKGKSSIKSDKGARRKISPKIYAKVLFPMSGPEGQDSWQQVWYLKDQPELRDEAGDILQTCFWQPAMRLRLDIHHNVIDKKYGRVHEVSLHEEIAFSLECLENHGLDRVYSPRFGNVAYRRVGAAGPTSVPNDKLLRHHDTWIARLVAAASGEDGDGKLQMERVPLLEGEVSNRFAPSMKTEPRRVLGKAIHEHDRDVLYLVVPKNKFDQDDSQPDLAEQRRLARWVEEHTIPENQWLEYTISAINLEGSTLLKGRLNGKWTVTLLNHPELLVMRDTLLQKLRAKVTG